MELKDFVRQTIEQVIVGVKEAHEVAKEHGAEIAAQKFLTDVEFDVAVTTTENTESKKGAGIFVTGIGLGAAGKSGTTNSAVSRIKFSVNVHLPRTSTPGSISLSELQLKRRREAEGKR